MSQASLPCTSLSARKLKKPNPDWIVFQCWMKTLEHNWTQKILLGVFQNSWYKVVLMDQVIFKYYGRDFTRCGDKLRRIAKEHLWILKRETRQCLILLKLYEKVLWLFVFTGYSLLCVCEMTKLVNAPSFLNMKNDKLNYKYASRREKSSNKTSMVFNDGSFGCVVNSCLVLSYSLTYQLAGISRVRTTLVWS